MPSHCESCKKKDDHKKKDHRAPKPTSRKSAIKTVLNNSEDVLRTIRSNEKVIDLLRENLVLVSTDKVKAQQLVDAVSADLKKLDVNRKQIVKNFEDFARRTGSVDPQAVINENVKLYTENNVIRAKLQNLSTELLAGVDPKLLEVAQKHVNDISKYVNANRGLERVLVELPVTLSLILATK
jgi:hypothetical protein